MHRRSSHRAMSALIKHGMALPLLASLLGCAPIGGPMGGNPGPGQNVSEADRMFVMAANTWDRNHDGQVTCGEWQAYVIELVATVDKSKDGALSEEEFAKLVQTDHLFATAGFKYWDTNKDGKVTRPEMLEHTNPAFTLLDRDTDCVLTSTELSAARSIQSSPEGGGGPPGGGGPGRGGPGGGSGSSPDMGGGSSSSWPN